MGSIKLNLICYSTTTKICTRGCFTQACAKGYITSTTPSYLRLLQGMKLTLNSIVAHQRIIVLLPMEVNNYLNMLQTDITSALMHMLLCVVIF